MTKKKHRLYKNAYQPKEGELLIMPRDERLLEASPYINTHKTLPDWFKNSSKQQGSIRRCAGTLDYLSLGATLPFWSNAYFTPNPNIELKWSVEMENLPFGNFFSNEPFTFESTGKCPMTRSGNRRRRLPKISKPIHGAYRTGLVYPYASPTI
jgi:hypothetical protein